MNNKILTLSPASCPSSIPQGATRNVTVAVDASPNNGTPPYVYRLYVDNVEKIRYPTSSGTTPNTSHIFSWTFNESVGSHTYKGQVTDSCSPTPKYDDDVCLSVNIIGIARPPPCDNYGDVDDDGYVTQTDADWILEYRVGLRNFTNEQKRRADVNINGKIDTGDVTLIQQYADGLIDTFPICSKKDEISTVVIAGAVGLGILYTLFAKKK